VPGKSYSRAPAGLALAIAAVVVVAAGAGHGPACHYSAAGGPDVRCTPGAHARVARSEVCQPGYATRARPPTSYTEPIKRKVMVAYGAAGPPGGYELDHRVPISLGGDPRAPANLWPEPGASPNAKDRVEHELYRALCAGSLTLAQAQRRILAWPAP
jgi:hypothetical protein